jgi:26S proteasome regulatory subunit T5
LSAGVLLYGPPGTGKTLLARACAAQTNATFLKLAGPQLVQMFIGDGAKLVRPLTSCCQHLCPGSMLSPAAAGHRSMRSSQAVSIHACTPVRLSVTLLSLQVRDAFALAKEKAPAIIFIDEIDAIGTKRFDSELSGDREVQRTMLELLNQLDGFGSEESIKVRRR